MWTDTSSVISPQNIAICLRRKGSKCSSASLKISTRLKDYALESVSLGMRKVLAHTLQRHCKLNLCAAAVQGFVLSPWHNTLPRAACWMPAQPLNWFHCAPPCKAGLTTAWPAPMPLSFRQMLLTEQDIKPRAKALWLLDGYLQLPWHIRNSFYTRAFYTKIKRKNQHQV